MGEELKSKGMQSKKKGGGRKEKEKRMCKKRCKDIRIRWRGGVSQKEEEEKEVVRRC